MKKILLSAVLVGSLFASEENYIELGAGYIKSKDNFSSSAKDTISSLNSTNKDNEGFALIDFYYAYYLGDDTSIYASSELANLNLGYNVSTTNGEFDIGVSGSFIGEEWENPFLTNTKRIKTDVKEFGSYVGYGLKLRKNYQTSLFYSYSKKKHDKETVQEDLKRDGSRHLITLENVYTLDDGSLSFIVNTSYEKYNAQGDASTYKAYTLELGLSTNLSENMNITLLTEFGKKDYDKSNPEFNKKVDATIKGATAVVTYQEPFGYKNVYTSLKAGHQQENANVSFYDKENTFTMISIGYLF